VQEELVIRLPGVSYASGPARRSQGLRDLPLNADRLDDLVFLMTELVTNGFFQTSGRSNINIEIHVLAEAVRVEVRSSEEVTQADGESRSPASPGWALAWLNESADRWGSEQDASCVWFEIDRRPAQAPT
jgi:hypothetical protein